MRAAGVLRRAAIAARRAVKEAGARWCSVPRDPVPPDSLVGATEKEIDEWRTEYDVITHLKAAGHELLPLGLSTACRN